MDMNFKKYKTVSFDIFDTLVSRRIYRPRDLFSLMQSTLATEKFFISAYEIGIIDNFPEIRVQAEVSARENRVRRFGGEPEILISEIYDEILKASAAFTSDSKKDNRSGNTNGEDCFI